MFDPERPDEPGPDVLHFIYALMLWPQDESARRKFEGLQFFKFLELLETAPSLKKDEVLTKAVEAQLRGIGGVSTLREMESERKILTDMQNRADRGKWAGGALCMAYLLHTNHAKEIEGGISLRKVRAFLARKGEQFFRKPPKEEALKEAWDEFKSVAPLWAAKFFVDHWMRTQLEVDPLKDLILPEDPTLRNWKIEQAMSQAWVRTVLPLAHDFQEFGLNYKPLKSSVPLLDPKVLWTLVDLPDWAFDRPRVFFLEDLIEILNDY
jgi:hypothetical protein